ncbi:MAG: ATP-binding protein [Epulopiscium sp.]|nr:ATP-binding protein [Candidatus Epulonipiscium sp.]
MATIAQVKALLQAHFEGDHEKFKVISLQIAAHEAKVGHTTSAREIKDIVKNSPVQKTNILKFNKNDEALELSYANTSINQLVVSSELKKRIKRVLEEYKKRDILLKNGLKNRSKLLLEGDTGTGKTMTASVIAYELSLPLYTIQIEHLISKYMGETSAKLKKVFEQIKEYPGVYLFDEFDAIGSDRTYDNDVGEMRRILNSFLQYIEQDDSASIIIAATNNPKMLDKALFRRFDDVLEYRLPDKEQVSNLLKLNLNEFATRDILSDRVLEEAQGLNHADIVTACDESLKEALLNDTVVNESILLTFLEDRKRLTQYKEVN